MPRWASSRSQRAGRREEATGRSGRMAEGIMERAALEALAAAGVPTALVDGTAPFRVRWANAAFARSLRLGVPAEGQPLLELLGSSTEGMATILRGLGDEGPLSVVVESGGETHRREREITRPATAGTSATIAGLLPMTVRPGRLKILRRALELGCRQSLPYAPGLPADERALLGEAGARWLVATPIRGRHGVLGAL